MSAGAAAAPVASPRPGLDPHERVALAALAFLTLATAAWWALALWPAPDAPPAWLARARWVCFNAASDGLPSASGWLLLAGEPLGFGVALFAAFGRSLRGGAAKLARSWSGRALALAAAAALAVGVGAAAARVATLAGARMAGAPAADALPDPAAIPRLDRPAPPLGLVDQRGRRVELGALRGRPALLTFAFAHCQALCPALVSQAQAAQRAARARGGAVPRLAIVTLDPWRDTPQRLPSLARDWRLGDGDFALSGAPADVNAVLDAYGVPRARRVDGAARAPVADLRARRARSHRLRRERRRADRGRAAAAPRALRPRLSAVPASAGAGSRSSRRCRSRTAARCRARPRTASCARCP